MKMRVQFTVARNALPRLGPAVQQAAAKVVRDTASEVAISAQNLAPVRTGALRAGIQPQDTEDPLTWEVISKQSYAGFVEYGTRFMDARPHMTPAFEAAAQTFPEDAARAIEAAIRKAA